MGPHAGLVMIFFVFAARFATRGTYPVRVLLVDKRSQPRTETAAIMALVGARLFCSMKRQFLKL